MRQVGLIRLRIHRLSEASPLSSGAGLLITTEAMIAEKPEPKGQGDPMPGGMGGMEGMM